MTQDDRDLLVKTSVMVDEIYRRLFGNGQPGEIDTIRKDVRGLTNYRNRVVGALSVISFLLLAFGGILLAHILH